MRLPLSYPALTNVVAFVRLLPMNDVNQDVEILALCYQLAVLRAGRQTPPRAARPGIPQLQELFVRAAQQPTRRTSTPSR